MIIYTLIEKKDGKWRHIRRARGITLDAVQRWVDAAPVNTVRDYLLEG